MHGGTKRCVSSRGMAVRGEQYMLLVELSDERIYAGGDGVVREVN